AGSAGVDVETAIDITIVDSKVHLIDSNIKGPLGNDLCALLLGRSSTSKQGIFVVPGVIDVDYEGIIKIMLYVINSPVSIPKGSRIAQLIPFHSQVPQPGSSIRGAGGFGSTGAPRVYFAMDNTKGKPEKQVKLTGPDGVTIREQFTIDTGADVTIIS
ncbi:POK9 protein, partial [Caloenas nicobarica]|nr:POK9 protein [Caloenas nicobarica]